MSTPRFAIATLLFFTFAARAEPEIKGTPAELQKFLRSGAHTVTLIGQAKDRAQADVAHVTVIVKTAARQLAAALAANAQERGALIQLLEREGIAAKNIRTGRFSTSPQYGWFGKTADSYEVINNMRVSISDERELMALARAADQSEPISIGPIEFEYTNRVAFNEKVRQSALDDALSKKRFYEERLGTTLRPVEFHFSDSGALPMRSGELGAVMVTGSRVSADDKDDMRYQAAAVLPPSFDEVRYEVSVSVTFELAAAPSAR